MILIGYIIFSTLLMGYLISNAIPAKKVETKPIKPIRLVDMLGEDLEVIN